jgi:splicing factor 3A subunit 2
MREQKDSSNLP